MQADRTHPNETLTDRHEGLDQYPAAALALPPQTGTKELSWEDMIIAYSTLPGNMTYRNTCRGAWFIESLVQIFMDMAADLDIK